MNLRRVAYVVGLLLFTISLTLLVPAAVAVAFGEHDATGAFLLSALIGFVFGLAGIVIGRTVPITFYRREGLAVVSISWIVCGAIGCLPYVFTGVLPSFIDAFFETISGFTTTGASVMTAVETYGDGVPTPQSILFWRSLTNWLGGVGIVVLFVALLPAFGVGGRLLFHFEVPGVGEKGFMPHIRQTAAALWAIYLTLTVSEILLLKVAGLTWFHAMCYSFATVATGGFAPHVESAAHYDSKVVHAIITVFMLLAGVNFTLYFRLRARRWRSVLRDTELRWYLGIVAFAIAALAITLMARGGEADFGTALSESAFQVASIVTTTGFATADFDQWPDFCRAVLVLLMFAGACAGSTAGGIKIIRLVVAAKFMVRQVRGHIRPRNVDPLRIGHATVSEEVARSVIGMVLLFVATYAVGALLLCALGMDLTAAFTASIAALGNIGPGLGSVGPAGNFAAVPDAGKVILTVLMLIGRLEIYTALSLITLTLWSD